MTLSSRPIPSNRHNPCPVCSGINGACRTLEDDTVFCHSLADARKGEKINGYICVKPASGHTATFKPDNSAEWSEKRRREWEALKAQRQQKAKLEEQQRRERALSADERHQLYTQILEQLSLDSATLNDLHKRGFTTAEIDACSFKSVAKWQKLEAPIDKRLPGIGFNGRSLITSGDGYLCPLYDLQGRIVALQLRLHNPPDGNRYRWLSSSGQTLALYPEGENPLTVLRPTGKPEGIALVEGTGAKPFLVAHRLNQLVIGAAGGQWTLSLKLLKQYLEGAHSSPRKEKIITLYPDAGDVTNPQVVHRWRKVANLLTSWGYTVTFAWWGQVDKSFPDIDELQPERYDEIRYLSICEFKALCIKWGGLKPEQESNITPIDYEQQVALAQKKLHSLTYPADIVCNPSKKYLPDLLGKIPLQGIVAIKARKGSGKSYQIKQIKNHCCGCWSERTIYPEIPQLPPEQLSLFDKSKPQDAEVKAPEPEIERIYNKGLGMKFLSINARIALGRGQAVQWDFTWIEDADIDGQSEFGSARISTASILENIDQIGLCWDSLGKVFGRDWSNTLVVIDEIELGLNHLTTSSTCKDRRSFILHTLEVKLKECLENNGLVVIADADLTDSSIDYLKNVTETTPFIVNHEFKGDPWEVEFYTGQRDELISQIEDWVSNENCEPIAVCMDNQKEAEALALHLINKYPYLEQEKNGLIRIDSKTTQTDFGREFVKHANEKIAEFTPSVLIFTPSLGVGVSLDDRYFQRVFGFCFGNVEPSQFRQLLARERGAVPRIIWCKSRANNSENEVTSYLPSAIKRHIFNYNDSTMQLLQIALEQAKHKAAREVEEPSDKDILPKLIETLQGMMGEDGSWNNPHLDLYCNQVAKRNYSLNQLAVQLRQELIDEGHHVYDFAAEEKTAAGDAVRDTKTEVKKYFALATAQAQDISVEQAQEIKRKPSRTHQEECQASKALLKRELPGVELTPDFLYKAVFKDDRRWLNQVKLFWMVKNPEAVKEMDKREWEYRLKQFSQGVPFLPDVKTYYPKVDAIRKSGIFELVNLGSPEREYSEDMPEVEIFFKQCLKQQKLIKTALNITVTEQSQPIKLIQRILGRVGLELTNSRTQGRGNDKTRYYKLNQELLNDPDRQGVLVALNERFESEPVEMAESVVQQATQPGQDSISSLNNNLSPVPISKPENEVIQTVVQHGSEGVVDGVLSVESQAVSDEMQSCESQVVVDVVNDCVELKENTGCWRGLHLRIKLGVEIADVWWKKLDKELLAKLGDLLLVGFGEPHLALDGTWRVWVNSVIGCKSVPCDWLELCV